ncbi:hypothetical protein D3C73_423610 [compost metagenome]
MSNRCVDPILPVLTRNVDVGITHNGEQIALLLHRVNGSYEHGIGTRDFPFFQTTGIYTHHENVNTLAAFPLWRICHFGFCGRELAEWRILSHLVKIVHLIVNSYEIISCKSNNRNQYSGNGP